MNLLSSLKAPLILFSLMLFGCATQVTETPSPVTPSKARFGDFEKVILVRAAIAPTYAKHEANIKAVNKIDEVFASRINAILDNVDIKTVEQVEAMKLSDPKVLVIKPYVKQIKFIGGAARFWAGAMAGSSVVVMDVAFERGDGQLLSNPGFMRKAGAYTDAFGVASNRMLNDVVEDVANYVMANK